MGPLIITIILSLATLTTQKTVKLKDIKESPELKTVLKNLINEAQSNYKDLNIKINLNNKKTLDDETDLKYLGEISTEKEGKEGFKSINKKLAKLLDGLQDNVMNENTEYPKCSCGYAGKHLPGVIKCQCGSDSDEYRPAENTKVKDEDMEDEGTVKTLHREKRQDSRKIRSVKDKHYEYRQMARFSNDYDRDDYYWLDDRCGCQLLRNTDDDDDLTLRCRCNSQRDLTRIGRDDNIEDGYWSDDNLCGCKLLRNADDDNDLTHYLRCRCNSPARVGENNDKLDGYWTDDNSCGCQLLRNTNDDHGVTHYLRCRCNSPARVGGNNDNDGYWTDDDSCGCQLLRTTDNNNALTHYLRCTCNSPRVSENNDRVDGYWTDDDSCGCQLLRKTNDDNGVTHYLRCGCNSPARVGENNDKLDGYWTDDDSCGCQLLRSIGKYKDLRCRCGPPSRTGRTHPGPNKYELTDNYSAVLSDLEDSGHYYQDKNSKASSDERSTNDLNTLMNFILKEVDNDGFSHPPKMDRVFIKLRDIMPSLRNVDLNELKEKIESKLSENEFSLREQANRQKSDPESHLTTKQIRRLLKVIEQQKEPANNDKKMYRRSMPEDAMGVPFTYEMQGLAQINI